MGRRNWAAQMGSASTKQSNRDRSGTNQQREVFAGVICVELCSAVLRLGRPSGAVLRPCIQLHSTTLPRPSSQINSVLECGLHSQNKEQLSSQYPAVAHWNQWQLPHVEVMPHAQAGSTTHPTATLASWP